MRVVLCDDNPKERDLYTRLVEQILGEEGIDADIVQYTSGNQLIFETEDELEVVDILLLDIRMPGMSGIEAARIVRDKGYKGEIVFLTVSPDHMPDAFDVRAFNYIVKGQTPRTKTVEILRGVIAFANEKSKEYMLFTGVGEYRNIPIVGIKYFAVNGKIITVHYGKEQFEFISTIGKVENLLFSRGFVRVHRSYLVALRFIKNFSFHELTLIDGQSIPVGRTYYSGLKEAIGKSAV